MKTHSLYSNGDHQWIILGRDPERNHLMADTNQVVLINNGAATLIDPGGIEVFPAFLSALTGLISIDKVERIILTSPDPDAISSIPLWRQVCKDDLYVSAPSLWKDLVLHLDGECEIQEINDDGNTISLSNSTTLELIPAHHLHAPASFSVYDKAAKVLYSSSIGSALHTANSTGEFEVDDFQSHISFLEDYHTRWFASSPARNDWLASIRKLQIDYMVPHRGPAFNKTNVENFLAWFSKVQIGIQLNAYTTSKNTPVPLEETNNKEPENSTNLEIQSSDYENFAALPSNPSGPPRGEPEPGSKYRLVTQSNFDGLVCAVILEQLDMIDDIIFVRPNDMQQGRIKISDNDICTNLPYVPGCHLGFAHHESELLRLGQKFDNHIIIPEAPSAARVVYDYYGGNEGLPNVSPELMDAVDQGTSAQYSMDEVLNPQRWALINFIMDFRTGLGRFRGFRIPNYELMMNLIEYCQFYSIEEILEIEDVKERVIFYKEQTELFKEQVERCSTIHGNLVVLDLREEVIMYVGNRFMIYALLPQCNISMHIMWGRDKQNVVFACGKSIFNRSSKTGIDDLMLKYGGGGHHAAGTCQIDSLLFNTVCTALIQQITEDG